MTTTQTIEHDGQAITVERRVKSVSASGAVIAVTEKADGHSREYDASQTWVQMRDVVAPGSLHSSAVRAVWQRVYDEALTMARSSSFRGAPIVIDVLTENGGATYRVTMTTCDGEVDVLDQFRTRSEGGTSSSYESAALEAEAIIERCKHQPGRLSGRVLTIGRSLQSFLAGK